MSKPLSNPACGLLRCIVWRTPRQSVQSAAFILAAFTAGLAHAHVNVPVQAPFPATSTLVASDPAGGNVGGTAEGIAGGTVGDIASDVASDIASDIANATASDTAGDTGGDTAGDERRVERWAAVDPAQLDAMRGGFDTGLRLTMSFGIERAVYLNGALVTTTSFNLPDMSAATGTQAAMATVSAPVMALVQSGPGNLFVPGAGNVSSAATVIQNTLSNQSIQSLTTINAAANSAQVLRSSAFQGLIRDGIFAGVVPR